MRHGGGVFKRGSPWLWCGLDRFSELLMGSELKNQKYMCLQETREDGRDNLRCEGVWRMFFFGILLFRDGIGSRRYSVGMVYWSEMHIIIIDCYLSSRTLIPCVQDLFNVAFRRTRTVVLSTLQGSVNIVFISMYTSQQGTHSSSTMSQITVNSSFVQRGPKQ